MSEALQAFIGVGSNLQEPLEQVRQAIRALTALPESRLLRASSLYGSRPMGPQDQPDYINAVVQIETRLSALSLLHALQAIEQQQGRVRQRHWGERTLDLDLLLYGEHSINLPELVVPHAGLAERNFVLYPLQEIAPSLEIPLQGPLGALVRDCPRADLQLITSA